MDEEINQIQREILNELRLLREQSAGSSTGGSSSSSATATPSTGNTDAAAKSIRRLSDSAEEADEELSELGVSSRGLNRAQIDQIKSAHEYKKALDTQADALRKGTDALKGLGEQLVSQQRGFEKYGKGFENLAGEVGKFAGTFGPAGKVIGATVAAIGKLGAMYMDQVDKLLKANDSLAQFGTAGAFTTKELMDMAHGAGVTSKNMDLLIKPITSLGPALINLGKNTGEGVKAFAEMTKITNAQREEYQRLGVSQEQLLQTQSDYVALQAMSGRNMKAEMKDKEALQRASLNYQDTLLELATLTGQDVESIKKKQQEAQRAVEWQISQIQLENKARKLESEGRTEEAKKLRNEAKARVDALNNISALGNETVTKGARQFLSTGTIAGEEAQALTRMGLMDDLKKLREEIKKGGDVTAATSKFQDAYNKKFGKTIDNVGFSAQHSADIAKQFGMSEQSLENYNRQRDQNFQEQSKTEKERIAAAKKSGKDPAQDARAKMTTAEIEAGKALDKLVGKINPLLGGFTALTVGGTVAAAALMGLAGAAGAKMLGNMGKSGIGAVKTAMGALRGAAPLASAAGAAAPIATGAAGAAATAAGAAAAPAAATAATAATAAGATSAAGAATTAASALAKLAGPLTKLSSAAPAIGTVMAVGEGVVDAYQGIKQADQDLKEGKITKEEAREAKGEAIGGGTGTAIGGAGGAWAGAAAGAAIGSVVPVIGTAIGGLLGAAVGGWLGSKGGKAIGEVAGGGIAKMTADADTEVDKAKKEASDKDKKDKKYSEEVRDSKTKDSKSKDVVKVQIVNPLPLPVAIVKTIEGAETLTSEKKPFAADTGTLLASALGPIGMLGKLAHSKFTKTNEDATEIPALPKKSLDSGTLLATALGPIGMLGNLVKNKFTENQPEIKQTTGIDKKLLDQLGESASFSPDLMKQFSMTASSLEDNKSEIGKDERAKLIPVSIQRIDDPNMLKALGEMGAEKSKETTSSKKPLMGTGTMTGMAIGTALLGPLGMLLGGIVGSKFNKAEQKPTVGGNKNSVLSNAPEPAIAKAPEPAIAKAPEPAGADNKLAELENRRAVFEKKGPATDSAQSILAHKNILQQLDRAIAAEKAKQSAPKAAVGGIFDGPKSGYPVELHGKEMVVPMATGIKTGNLASASKDDDDDELEEERKAILEFKKGLEDTDSVFKKLIGSSAKLNEIEKEKIEDEEEASVGMTSVQDKLKNVFNNAAIDLGKFSNKIKIVTQETSTGPKIPDSIGGILGGAAGGGAAGGGAAGGGAAGGGAAGGGAAGGAASAPSAMPIIGEKPPTTPPPIPSSMSGAPPVKQDVKQNLGEVKAAMMKRGMGDEKYLNAVLGNVMKESGGKIQNENLNYGKTSNERIRSIFGSRAKGKSDEELNQIKSSPESMGEFMYGKDTKIGRGMGNLEPGDGFKYRGRGYIQLTGKSNYAAASQAIFGDDTLVKNPDLVNDPKIAADVVAWYMERGKKSMAKKMGIDDKNMSQEQANLLATSQIAGVDVRKAGGYLGGEVMQKVAGYAGSKEIQGIEPASGGTMVASTKEKIPQAKRGGVFEGPDSGYIVELHGNEIVIPTEKIASVAQKELESVTKMAGNLVSDQNNFGAPDTGSFDTFMSTGLDTKNGLAPAMPEFDGEMFANFSDKIQDLTEGNKSDMTELFKGLQDDFKATLNQLTQRNEPVAAGEGRPKEDLTSVMVEKLDQIITQLSQSNSTQDKLLQHSRV